MERILITGATGLIGQEVLSLLINEYDCWVVGRHIIDKEKIHFIQQDIGKPFALNKFPEQVDYIIHLAQSDEHNDFQNCRNEMFNVNVYGMMQLLNYGVKAKAKKFLFASSGGIYGSLGKTVSEDRAVTISDSMNFYQRTKLCMEILARNYQVYFNIITFRFFFVYGKDQKENMLFPRLIKNIAENEIITVGALEDIKMNPIYKTDAARCVYIALKKINGSQIFNIAGDDITSLGVIAKKIAQQMDRDIEIKYEDRKQPDMIADIRKMKELLWKPQVGIDEGIVKLLSNFRNIS